MTFTCRSVAGSVMDLPWISAASAIGKSANRTRAASIPRSTLIMASVSVLEMLLHKGDRALECIVGSERAEILREAVVGVWIGHKLHFAAECFRNIIKLPAEFDTLTPVRFAVHDQERWEALGLETGNARDAGIMHDGGVDIRIKRGGV